MVDVEALVNAIPGAIAALAIVLGDKGYAKWRAKKADGEPPRRGSGNQAFRDEAETLPGYALVCRMLDARTRNLESRVEALEKAERLGEQHEK